MSNFSQSNAAKVKLMVVYGYSRQQIARRLDISVVELDQFYDWELQTAAIEANAMNAANLFRAAVKGKLRAICFVLKAFGGWSETAYLHNRKKYPTIPSPGQYQLSLFESGAKAALPDLLTEACRRGLNPVSGRSQDIESKIIAPLADRLRSEDGH